MKIRTITYNKILFLLVFLLIFNFSGCSPKTPEPDAGFIPKKTIVSALVINIQRGSPMLICSCSEMDILKLCQVK